MKTLMVLVDTSILGYNNQCKISDNTNILWNSPSLGKITAVGYPWFYKTTPFLCFEGKKQHIKRAYNCLLHSTTNHFPLLFMSNMKYSYTYSAVTSSDNISSQSLTGLYNLLGLLIPTLFRHPVSRDQSFKYSFIRAWVKAIANRSVRI